MNLYDFIYGYLKDHIQDDEIARGLTNHIHYQARKKIKKAQGLFFILGIVFALILLKWIS